MYKNLLEPYDEFCIIDMIKRGRYVENLTETEILSCYLKPNIIFKEKKKIYSPY